MKKRSMSLLALCLAASMIFAGTAFASDPDSDNENIGADEVKDDYKEPEEEVKTDLSSTVDTVVDAGTQIPPETPTARGDDNEVAAESSVGTPAADDAEYKEKKEEKEEVKTEYIAEPVQEAPAEAVAETAAEAAAETAAEAVVEADISVEEEPVIIESGEITYDDEDWPIEAFEGLTYVITGIQDYGFAEGVGHKYDIHHGVTINSGEVVSSVLFDTSGVDFTTPGTYEITYYVYFHRVMFAGWLDLYDIDHADYPGVDSDADRIKVTVTATVTVTEDETSEEQSTKTTAENEPKVIEVEGAKGSNVVWTYSIIEADSSEITDDVLSDWYFNYVEPSGHTWDVIVYTDKPDMGVFAQFDLVQKDTYLQVDNDYRDADDDDIQSTYYRAIDGEMVIVVEPGDL